MQYFLNLDPLNKRIGSETPVSINKEFIIRTSDNEIFTCKSIQAFYKGCSGVVLKLNHELTNLGNFAYYEFFETTKQLYEKYDLATKNMAQESRASSYANFKVNIYELTFKPIKTDGKLLFKTHDTLTVYCRSSFIDKFAYANQKGKSIFNLSEQELNSKTIQIDSEGVLDISSHHIKNLERINAVLPLFSVIN